MPESTAEPVHSTLSGRRTLLALPLFLMAVLPAAAARPPSPPVVTYTIEASLDPTAKTVTGKERLVWRNPSGDSVSELRFHLYLNAFKNNRTTFLREWGGRLREDLAGSRAQDWGSIDIDSMVNERGEDLKPGARFVQPDANDASDETVLAVALPSPVPPGGAIALDFAFRDKLPRVFARTGFVRDFFLVAQWFPKIGVYEPAGLRGRPAGGWNCHAFHANSEFYADYGAYDVTLTVPSRFIIGATGRKIAETKKGSVTTYRFQQDDIHDFAWTADPRYVVVEFPFSPPADVPAGWSALAARQLGMAASQIALTPVSVRLLLQPNHLAARDAYVRSAKEALSFYGLWFGAYPYPTLTIVDPPDDGLGAGGMEYPTLITGDAPSLFLRWPFQRVRFVEDVTVHEFGHQYWYGMVGSNEFEESWLDEGINSDAEYRNMELAYGRGNEILLPGGLRMGLYAIAHIAYLSEENLDPISRFSWRFSSGNSYGLNSYFKVALFLAQLRHDLGDQTFARAERAYFQEWSFRHPSTSDFFAVFERVCGCDLSTYRANLVEGTARLDWSVASAGTSRVARDDGMFDRGGKRVTLEEGAPAGKAGAGEREKEAGKPGSFNSSVLFGNVGEWPHAAQARLVFEDGKVLDWTLPAAARWIRLRIRYRSRLAWAAVDPEGANVWEWKLENNSRVLGAGRGAADTAGARAVAKYSGWAAHFAAILQQLLWSLA
ncbi:MAG TPA: M1 family metallopeptidase [Thermoanaerobaculia bacterium]|nr:M1 family metallopeptidase [Thermoanaerobaculia bacterium]